MDPLNTNNINDNKFKPSEIDDAIHKGIKDGKITPNEARYLEDGAIFLRREVNKAYTNSTLSPEERISLREKFDKLKEKVFKLTNEDHEKELETYTNENHSPRYPRITNQWKAQSDPKYLGSSLIKNRQNALFNIRYNNIVSGNINEKEYTALLHAETEGQRRLNEALADNEITKEELDNLIFYYDSFWYRTNYYIKNNE